MTRYIVEVWETRAYWVPVDALNEDEAQEIATEIYAEKSTRDEFVSVEYREITKAD
jgi:hypothetical protein